GTTLIESPAYAVDPGTTVCRAQPCGQMENSGVARRKSDLFRISNGVDNAETLPMPRDECGHVRVRQLAGDGGGRPSKGTRPATDIGQEIDRLSTSRRPDVLEGRLRRRHNQHRRSEAIDEYAEAVDHRV